MCPFDVYPVLWCTLLRVPSAACCRWRISHELQILWDLRRKFEASAVSWHHLLRCNCTLQANDMVAAKRRIARINCSDLSFGGFLSFRREYCSTLWNWSGLDADTLRYFTPWGYNQISTLRNPKRDPSHILYVRNVWDQWNNPFSLRQFRLEWISRDILNTLFTKFLAIESTLYSVFNQWNTPFSSERDSNVPWNIYASL